MLYNNADGTYEVNTITKAHVVSSILWKSIHLFDLLSIGMEQSNGIHRLFINLIVRLIFNIIHLMNKIVH